MKYSDCCGAPLYDLETEICSKCKEHCESIDEKEPEPLDPETVVTPEQKLK